MNWKTDAERLSGNEEFLSVAQVMALQSWALSTLFPGQDHPKPNDVYSTFKAQMGCLAASFVKKTNASRSMIQRFFAEALAWDGRNTLASLRLAGYKSGQEGIECLERGRDMFDPDRGFDSRIMAYLLCDLGNRYWEERRSGDALKTYLADSLSGKDDSGFLGLHRHGFVVVRWRMEVGRSRRGRKVRGPMICADRW